MKELKNKRILLGVCGSIAAYKAPELVRKFVKLGAKVTCVLTRNGARFVTPLTLKTLSGGKVYEDMWDPYEPDIEHISLSKAPDLIVIAPATADVIARLSWGRADDLLASVVLATRKPVLICPAMNDKMWLHKATKDSVVRLKKYGYKFVEPAKGALACGDEAVGRLAALDDIIEAAGRVLTR
jgi:phosphopantothenoylcysteine synthetase/decarboxylase